MAMAISNVPVLTREAAEAFVRKADEAMSRRGSIDFTEQRAEMKLILANAKFEYIWDIWRVNHHSTVWPYK